MYIGLADYKMGTAGWTDPKQVANQIALNRAQGHIAGQIHFRHAFLAADPLGYRSDLQKNVYNRPALIPTMPWKGTTAPLAPSGLAASQGENAVVLTWAQAGEVREELEKVRQFAVYRSPERAIDIEAPQNLLGLTHGTANAYADTKVEAGKYYYYTVTALNRLSQESAPANVVSNDFEAPAVRTRDATVTLSGATASLQPADVDGGSSDNWDIASLGLSQTTFSCSDIGTRKVVLSAVDKAGLSASAEATVNVLGRVPQPAIAVSRFDTTPTNAAPNAIVLGYGAQSLTLSATDADTGTTLAWTPAAGLAANGAVATFTPTAAGSYSFSVQAVSENGCPALATVTIPVIDARCGDGKVAVCHKPGKGNGKDGGVCVAPSAVQAFIRKGETLGSCM
jgi:hypothetical protein